MISYHSFFYLVETKNDNDQGCKILNYAIMEKECDAHARDIDVDPCF
jgi:hypothetical protein